ncbi:hypothetical protein N9145_03170, partial [bacterium]|nr:hypothetical protein [bacterium]
YRNLNVTNTYAEYFIDDEVSEEDRALRKDVGKLETIGGLGEYLDVSIDKTFAMPGFARAVTSIMSPWVALTVTAMDVVFNDKTLHLADYMSAGLSALKAFGVITPPASAAEVKAAGAAAEVAADATWKVGDAFTSVGRSAMDTFRAANVGTGLAGMSYSQTVGLINAAATGDPMSYIFSEFGSDLVNSSLEEFGVDLDTLDPGIKQGLYKGMNKLAQGEDWETAFTSGVATWLRDTELGGDFIDSLRGIGRDLDDQYLQPILDAIPDEINSGDLNLPKWDEITEWAAGAVGGLTDGFKVILSEMNNIIPGISDESRAVIGEFVEAIPTTNIESAISKLGQMTGGVFDNLDEGIKDALEQGLQDAVINGEVDEAAMARAVSAGAITVNAIGEQFPEYLQDVAGARLITQSIQNAVTSAMLGGDASDAFLQTIATAATKAIQKSIDEGTLFDDLAQYQDRVTGEYTKTRLATDRMNTAQSTYNQAFTGAKAIEAEMQEREEALEVLRVRAETTGRESDQDAYDDAFQSYSMYIADEAGPRYNNFVITMNDAEQDFTDAKTDFDAASVDLNDATVVLNDNVAPVYQDVMKGAVAEIDPNFDEAWYRQKYDIPDGVSAYDHYINSGVQFGTPTNADAYTAQYDAAFNKLMDTAIQASGINPAKLSPEELKRIRNQLTNRYGDDIQSLKDGLANEAGLKWRVQSVLMALSDLGNSQPFVLTEQNIDSMRERLEAAGIPFEDLKVGDSVAVSDRRKLSVSESNQKSAMGIELGGATDWADVVSGDAQLTFDPVSGKLTWEVLSTEGMQSVSYDDEYGLVLQGTDRFGNDVLTVQENNNQYAIVDGEMKPLNGTFAGPDGQDVQYVNGDIKLRENQTITEQTDDGGFRFYEANANNETQVATYDEEGNLVGSVPYQETDFFDGLLGPSSFESLMTTDPELWLSTLGEMPESVGEDVAGNWWYRTAKRITNTLNSMAESGQTIPYVPYGVSSDYLYMQTLLNKATDGFVPGAQEQSAEQFVNDSVNSLQSMNEFMQSINWTWEAIKQMTPTVQQDYMLRAGIVIPEGESIADSKFQQVTQAVGDMAQATHTEEYRAAAEAFQKVLADDGLWEAIDQFPGMFAQEIVMHELKQELPTLLIGGVAKLGGTLVSKGLGMSDEVVASVSAWTGFTGAVATDMAEAYGGEAGGAYTELYDLATTPKFNAVTGEMEAPMTEEEAEKFASENAHLVGVGSMMLTGLTMGIGGADMYKSIFGKDLAKATVKEKNTFLRMYDSIRPVGSEAITGAMEEGGVAAIKESIIYNSGLDPDRDYSQNIITSAQLGFILEGTVAGAVTTLPRLDTGSPESRILVNGNGPLRIELVDTLNNGGSSADVEAVLNNFGIEDTAIRTDILDLSFDSEYNSSQEVSVMFEDLGFAASDADITNFVGAVGTGTDLTADVAEYIDPLFTDRGEVQEAALAEGVILTDEEADLYVGQDTEENVTGVLKLDIQDPNTDVGTPAVTVEQIKNEFLSNGRIITDAQAEQFLGDTLESAQTDISEFLEEKPGFGSPTVGTGKVRATGIDDHGVYLTNAQMQQFLSKYGPEDISAAIGEWAASEPEGIRYTITEQQVRDYAESKGYTLSDEEVATFTRKTVGAAEIQLQQRFQNDPEFGTLIPAAQNELNALRDDLNERIDAIMENDPNTSRLDAIDAALESLVQADNEFVTHGQLVVALSQMGGDIDADIKEVADSVADVETRLAKAFADALEVEGTTRDQAIAAAVTQVSGDLDVTKAALLKTINTDDAALDSKMTELNDARVAEIATLRTNVWNAIGELRTDRDGQAATDEELQDAIDKVAGDLGTTSADIYSKLNTNAAELNTLDQEVADLETDLNDKIDANLAADMERDDAVNKAIADIVAENKNFTTHAEVAEYLSDYRTGEEITAEIKTVADSVTALETELVNLINANADESLTEDQKLDQAIQDLAGSTNTSVADIYSRLGAEETARKKVNNRLTKLNNERKAEIAELSTAVWAEIDAVKERIGSNDLTDAQLQEAIDEVAGDLSTTSDDIYSKLNTNAAGLNALDQEVSDLETDLNDKIGANLAADMERDDAVNKAIADIVAEN